LVIDEHNVWSELTTRRRALRRPGPRGALDRFESRQLVATEDRAWSSAAGVIFCSEREADGARRRVPGGRIAAIPNGVDLAAFQPEPAASEARHQEAGLLTFVGLLRYTPNADAVRWFVRDILPLVRRQDPSARFEAVGKTPSPAVLALAADDVRIVGSVPDVRPFLARASVVVVPLRAGSGTRIKILEALAMGKAVVTTSIGCEGLAVRDGVHLLVADDRESFAAATARLLAVPELRARLGAAGRALVERDYSWSTSVDRLARFHDEILGDVDATDADARRGLGA
jgi:glycosyltransferase involved in cell wall biosynthesis